MELMHDYLASRVISQGKELDNPNYGRMYYKVNEDLNYLKEVYDLKEKSVLSVLSSADHVFSARHLGASVVDSFDINRLTIYYYYLRKWTIKYTDKLYPILDIKWLRNLLSKVKPDSEEEKNAWLFYSYHCKNNTELDNMFFDIYAQPKGRLYCNNDSIKSKIDMDMQFYNIDLFKDISLEKKYDVLLISNILEWAHEDKEKLENAKNNMTKLLSSDGVIICSKLVHTVDVGRKNELEIFEPEYDYLNSKYSRGYVYKRKK